MKAMKKLMITVGALCTVMAATGVYMFKIEPKMLTLKTVEMDFSNSEAPQHLKIIQFSDTHLSDAFTMTQLEETVRKINKQNPDIVLFTGDLMDRAAAYETQDEAAAVLSEIQARMGKYAVWGNHDYGGGGVRVYADMMAEAGFTLLENQNELIPLAEDKTLEITGLDDALLGDPDLSMLTERTGDFRLVMAHEPDLVEEINEDYADMDLVVSGHSHGGQVWIPGKGALVKTPMAEDYSRGAYDLGFTKLYVNPGLGTTKIAARLMNPPEITVFELTVL
ncbi:MAG: metallophosphoesterase [Eubacterium sp.]